MIIATHSGTFHADVGNNGEQKSKVDKQESLAVALLRSLPSFKDSKLVRTRDPAKLDQADIVVDVGGTYNHEKQRFDHHQRGFEETFGAGWKTKLSSAGLIYKHYGKDIIANHLGCSQDDERVEVLYPKIYEDFVEGLDGIDNGISQYTTDTAGATVNSQYKNRTDLSSRVGKLNPTWNQPYNDEILDAQFEIASSLAASEFFLSLSYAANAWLPARDLVLKAYNSRPAELDSRVLVFEGSLPWKEHLYEIEKEQKLDSSNNILYVLYPDEASKWRIQAVPQTSESFASRKALPEPWRGLRDEALSEKTGVPGCIFIHASGFIGGHQTKEGAIQLVKLALQ